MAPTQKRIENNVQPDLDDKIKKAKMADSEEDPAVTLFRDYLRIKTVHPDPDYENCMIFLKKQADRLGLKHHITEIVKGKPILIMTWRALIQIYLHFYSIHILMWCQSFRNLGNTIPLNRSRRKMVIFMQEELKT